MKRESINIYDLPQIEGIRDFLVDQIHEKVFPYMRKQGLFQVDGNETLNRVREFQKALWSLQKNIRKQRNLYRIIRKKDAGQEDPDDEYITDDEDADADDHLDDRYEEDEGDGSEEEPVCPYRH